jgi:hypothetical protein
MAKLTRDQIQQRFLDHLEDVVYHTEHEDRWPTVREKIRGAIFSVLVAIDGESHLPSFVLSPCPHPSDRAYHEEMGEDYYPEEDDECDIAGNLHEQWAVKDCGNPTSH